MPDGRLQQAHSERDGVPVTGPSAVGPPARRAYEVVGADARTARSRPAASLAVAAVWATVLVDAALTVLARRRSEAWHDAVRTGSTADALRARAVEGDISRLATWGWVVLVVTLASLAAWTATVLSNARRRGIPLDRPTVTALLWLIPVFGARGPIRALSSAVQSLDYSDRRLTHWLFAMYVNLPLVFLFTLIVGSAYEQATNDTTALAALRREASIRPLLTLVVLVWAVLGTRAVLHADRAITGRPARRR